MRALILFSLVFPIVAKDHTINFIKSFVDNEQKPTSLVYKSLCWGKCFEIKLTNEMFKHNVKVSSSLELRAKYQDHNLLFLMDLDCPGAEEVILNAIDKHLFRSPYRWLVLTNSSERAMTSGLWTGPILPDSDFVLAERTGDLFTLIELHKVSTKATMQLYQRGYYNGTLVDTRPRRELFWRRRNLLGHPLVMAHVIQDSNTTQYHLIKEDRLELQYDLSAKLSWMNVKVAFEMLNVTPQHRFSHRWGYKQDGKWSGMIDDLDSGRADLGSNCVVSIERLDVVAFTDMVAPIIVRFIFRQPPLPYVSNIFYLPFSLNVWVGILICIVFAVVCLHLASKWEIQIENSPTQLQTASDAVFLTMSAVSQQGCIMEPKKLSGRITVWVLFTALMALYAAYSANIIVLLQAPSNSIKNLAQLAYSKLTLGANDVDYNHFVFKLYKDPARVEIYKKIDPQNGKKHFYNLTEGVEKIRQGLFAFHFNVEPVYYQIKQTFLESEKCDLVEIDFMNVFAPAVPMKKNSPYLELFKVVLKKIREVGIHSALGSRYRTFKPQCVHQVSAFSSVGLIDLRPVLMLMVYGLVLSVATAIVEIIVYKIHNRHMIIDKKRRK